MKECSEEDRIARVRNLCRTDLFFLFVYGLGRLDADNEWCFARCREVQADPDNRLDLWAREHYKSSIITFAKTIQDILATHGDGAWLNEEITVGIFSHTRPIAKAFLRQIKQEFETNELLKAWFPDVLWASPRDESPKWSEDEGITVKRKGNPKEATIEAWGLVDGQPTSKHFKLAIYDDTVTRESVTTPEMIKKTTSAWELSRNLTAIGGVSRYIGTRYHFFDTYSVMMERGISARIHPATEGGKENGKPVFFDVETLAQKRIEMGDNFAPQMLLQPRSEKDAYFKQDWYRWYETVPKHLRMYGASDYATKQGGGDWTVHSVVGVDSDDNLYVVDVWRGQTESDIWVEKFIDLILLHKPLQWGAPSDQIKRSIGPFMRKRMLERKAYCNVIEMSEAGTKPEKTRSFQARMAMGKVYFPKYAPWLDDLLMEFNTYPVGHDDQADTLGIIGRLLDTMAKGQSPNDKQKPQEDRWRRAFSRQGGSSDNNWKVG